LSGTPQLEKIIEYEFRVAELFPHSVHTKNFETPVYTVESRFYLIERIEKFRIKQGQFGNFLLKRPKFWSNKNMVIFDLYTGFFLITGWARKK
jgi:hypothetical protein